MKKIPLFLHIPKTAGSTLNRWLYDQLQNNEIESDGEGMFCSGIYFYPLGFFKERSSCLPDKISRVLGRSDIRAVVGHFSFGIHQHVIVPSTYVTLLRDPIERIISLYDHLEPEMSIDEFVENYNIKGFERDQTRLLTDNDQTRRISGIEPRFGRCSWRTLEKAKNNIRKYFTVVGVTERFDETLVLIRRKLGLKGSFPYIPRLINRKRTARTSMSQRSIELIAKRNSLDMELHAFGRDMLDEQISSEGEDFYRELDQFKVINAQHVSDNLGEVEAWELK